MPGGSFGSSNVPSTGTTFAILSRASRCLSRSIICGWMSSA